MFHLEITTQDLEIDVWKTTCCIFSYKMITKIEFRFHCKVKAKLETLRGSPQVKKRKTIPNSWPSSRKAASDSVRSFSYVKWAECERLEENLTSVVVSLLLYISPYFPNVVTEHQKRERKITFQLVIACCDQQTDFVFSVCRVSEQNSSLSQCAGSQDLRVASSVALIFFVN